MGMRATDLATSSGSGSTASPIVRPAPGQILPPPLPPVVPESGFNQPGSTAGQKSQQQVTDGLFDKLTKKSSAKQDATQVSRNTPLAQQKEKEEKSEEYVTIYRSMSTAEYEDFIENGFTIPTTEVPGFGKTPKYGYENKTFNINYAGGVEYFSEMQSFGRTHLISVDVPKNFYDKMLPGYMDSRPIISAVQDEYSGGKQRQVDELNLVYKNPETIIQPKK